MELYTDLNITDGRFTDISTINPTPLDGAYLQNFDEFREVIAQGSIFGDVDSEAVKKKATQEFD